MEEHFQSIRVAIAAPSEEAHQAARAACRALLQVLEAAPPAGSAAPSEAPSSLRLVPTAADAAAGTSAEGTAPQPEGATTAQAPREPDPVLCDPTEVPPPSPPAAALPSSMALPPSLRPLLAGVMGGAIDPSHVAALVAAAQSLKPEQWVDLLLSKLQTLLGSRIALQPMGGGMGAISTAPAAPVSRQPFRFQIVPIPPGWTSPPAKGRK